MRLDRRYFSRQLALSGFGPAAQRRLARGRALVVGLGGTGCTAATHLALAGVGSMVLVDRDVVSLENLHRQPIYSIGDVGMSKAEVAARFLQERAPRTEVRYLAESLGESNSSRLTAGVDVAVDCLDNLAGRYALNAACVADGIPMVHTGGAGWEGSVAVFSPPGSGCFECLFPRGAPEEPPGCDEVGVLGPAVSAVASMGAAEAVKLLAGLGSSLLGRMLVYDARRGEPYAVRFGKRKDCPTCGEGRRKRERARLVSLCGGGEFYAPSAYPPSRFERVLESLAGSARTRRMGQSLAVVTLEGGEEVSLFKRGGVLIRGAETAEEAEALLRALRVRGPESPNS